jgi:hypothetical protein
MGIIIGYPIVEQSDNVGSIYFGNMFTTSQQTMFIYV